MSIKFLFEFLRHPINTGAVAPSSKGLARRMVSSGNLPEASVVVEFGPGTGVFTEEILKCISDDAVFCVIENNPRLYSKFCARFPDVKAVEDSAANIKPVLKGLGVEKADCILCGLPWASFSEKLQDSILSATLDVLPEGGRFSTFAYLQGLLLPSGRSFKRKLHASFSEVRKSPVSWFNLPPGFVYQCRK